MHRVGVVVLLVLAGCSAGLGPTGTETAIVTPAPVPSETASQTPEPRLPAGVTVAGGITDPWLVTTRSAEQLAGTNYTRSIVEELRYSNGTPRWRLEREIRVGADRSFTVEIHRGHDRPGWAFASADRLAVFTAHTESPARTRSYWAVSEDGNTRYEILDGVARANSRTLFRLLSRFDTRVTGRTTRNGTLLYRIEAEARGAPRQMRYADRTERARNVTLAVLIDPDGVIHRWRVAYTTVEDGTEVRYTRTERVTDIGVTTVPMPDWVDRLRDGRTPTPVAAGSRASGAEP